MPLIHKCDCKGLLVQLQAAVRDTLRYLDSRGFIDEVRVKVSGGTQLLFDMLGQSIATILTYDTEDSAREWMTASTMDCLAAHLSAVYEEDENVEVCRAKLDELPRSIVVDLLVLSFKNEPNASGSVAPRGKRRRTGLMINEET